MHLILICPLFLLLLLSLFPGVGHSPDYDKAALITKDMQGEMMEPGKGRPTRPTSNLRKTAPSCWSCTPYIMDTLNIILFSIHMYCM